MEYKIKNGYVLVRMETGENVIENIRKIFKENKFLGGIIVDAVGQLQNVKLGYYSLSEKKYFENKFNEVFELLEMSGNISWDGEDPVPHIHVVLGRKDSSVLGGHLSYGEVGATLELFIKILDQVKLVKQKDEKTGLKLLSFRDQ